MKRSNSQDIEYAVTKKAHAPTEKSKSVLDWQIELLQLVTDFYQNEAINKSAIVHFILKFLNEAPLESLDFNAILQNGPYRGSTINHVLVQLSLDNYYELLYPILERQKQLDFTIRPQDGIHAGMSAFEILVESVCKNYENDSIYNCQGHYALLKYLLEKQKINCEELNNKFISGTYKGKSILFVIASILPKNSELMRIILTHCDVHVLNFNDKVEFGLDSGKTTLWLMVKHSLGLPPYCSESLDFNAKAEQDSLDQGKTVLYFMVENIEKNLYDLLHVLMDLPLHRLDFNVVTDSDNITLFEKIVLASNQYPELVSVLRKIIVELPEIINLNRKIYKGHTIFSHIAMDASNRQDPTLLSAILDAVPVESLVLAITNPDLNTANPLGYIANLALEHPEPLTRVLKNLNLQSIDLNEIPFKEISDKSILWLIAIAAEKHNPDLFMELMTKCSVEKLDMSQRANYQEFNQVTLREWLLSTRLAGSVHGYDVLLSIAKARSAIAVINKDYAEDKPVDPIKIKEIEKHLQTLENNIQHASSVLPPTRLWAAGFYQEMGLVEHLKNLAKSLTKQDMFYNEILRMLSETIIYGPQTYDENNDPDFSKKAHKHKLLEAFDYSLEVQDSKELRKNIAFNFVYGVDNKCAGFPTQSNEPLLDHLEGGKETCLYAIKALRQKVKLQKSSEEKDKKIKQLEAEIAAMKAKQHI